MGTQTEAQYRCSGVQYIRVDSGSEFPGLKTTVIATKEAYHYLHVFCPVTHGQISPNSMTHPWLRRMIPEI